VRPVPLARHPAVDDSLWIAQGARREGPAACAGRLVPAVARREPVDAIRGGLRRQRARLSLLARAPELARAGRAASPQIKTVLAA
jgi:hypothetical protein